MYKFQRKNYVERMEYQMKEKQIMEFVLATLINEVDELISKYEVSEESASIRIIMLDGKQFHIICSEVFGKIPEVN